MKLALKNEVDLKIWIWIQISALQKKLGGGQNFAEIVNPGSDPLPKSSPTNGNYEACPANNYMYG